MLKELADYDWQQAFGFAGEKGCEKEDCSETVYNQGVPERALPNDDISVEPFGREQVKRIIAHVEGEHDGDDWLIVGELRDGRFFALSAGCDYTGWD